MFNERQGGTAESASLRFESKYTFTKTHLRSTFDLKMFLLKLKESKFT